MSVELTVVTPEGQAFEGSVESVVLPGTEGEFGVLAGHEVFMTALAIGEMTIDKGGELVLAAISRGFAEVHEDSVTVMVGSCEFADDIDREAAEVAAERARKQLEEMRETAEGEDVYQEYQEAYSKAVARVSISKKFKG
jgi:F-type H+-transporting ATPase subunit epsilon